MESPEIQSLRQKIYKDHSLQEKILNLHSPLFNITDSNFNLDEILVKCTLNKEILDSAPEDEDIERNLLFHDVIKTIASLLPDVVPKKNEKHIETLINKYIKVLREWGREGSYVVLI